MSAARRRSRLTSAGLRRRAFEAGPTASVAVAVLVAVAALLAVAAPRAVERLHTDALAAQLATATAYELDIGTGAGDRPQLGPPTSPTTLPPAVDAVWGGQEERLVAIRDSLPEPLRGVTRDPLAVVTTDPLSAPAPGHEAGGIIHRVELTVDPRLREHVRLADGAWPTIPDAPPPPATTEFVLPDGSVLQDFSTANPLPGPLSLALATATAEALEWPIGETRTIDLENGPLAVRLTGTFEATDPDDGFWSHLPTGLRVSTIDDGRGPIRLTASAFVDPVAWQVLADQPLVAGLSVWIPIATGDIRSADSAELEAELDEFSSTAQTIGDGSWVGRYPTVGSVVFASGLQEHLAGQRAESAAVDAVLATVASGPAGVMVAVLVLGARAVFERRRVGLELAAARGASTGWLRSALGVEGLAIGIPAALLGGAIAIALTFGETAWSGWTVAAVFALAPAVLLIASAPSLTPLRRARADLGRAGSALRWVWETLVVIVTAIAVGLLIVRGPSASGVDPLLAAVPLLVALTGCAVVLRLYPLPLAAVVRRAKAGRGLVAFVGSARALRDPAAGLVPVLAVVVGVAIAVSSAITLTTLRAGAETVSAATVGADASVTGTPLTKAQLDLMRAVPGVEAIAPVYSTSPVDLVIDGRHNSTTLIVVDIAEMSAVQAGRAEVPELPSSLAVEVDPDGDGEGGPVPVLLSTSVAHEIDGAAEVDIEGAAFEVVDVTDGRTAYSPRTSWILVDRVNAAPFTDTLVPRTVLVRFTPAVEADPAAATTAIAELGGIAGPDAVVTTPSALESSLLDRPNAQGLATGLIVAIVLSSLLTALALLLALVVGRPARERLLPLLATLGLTRRGERGLVAWEGPMTVAAAVVGTALGIATPYLVLSGIDLTAFTGGDGQPAITIDVPLVAGVLVLAIAVASAGAFAASWLGGRVGAARALRKEEEG